VAGGGKPGTHRYIRITFMDYFGIDIGYTAIKFGEVRFGEKIEISNFDMMLIPQTSRTEKYTKAILDLFQPVNKVKGVGIGFPSVVWEDGIINLDIQFNEIWKKVAGFMQEKGIPHYALNDADAAGFAELCNPMAIQLRKGVTLVMTLGIGIGSALFLDGRLLPNTEFGLAEIHGIWGENYTAASVKAKEKLSMKDWAARLQEYLSYLEILLSPDHIVIGGGISSDFKEFMPYLKTKRAKVYPAQYRNQAGVIGAAMFAAYKQNDYLLQ
jgi:polyphosphate glucokinase